jgi:hypothetical protein
MSHKSALAGILLFGAQFFAQAQTSSTNTGLTVTSAIVGVTSTQTAQLNVLNLQPVISGVTAVACPATLEFYNESGALLKQLAVTNIPPTTAVSLTFNPPVPAAAVNSRAPIRAVVVTPSISTVGTGNPPTPILPFSISCSVMSSLEITDNSTGATQTFTTDFRAMQTAIVLPLAAAR